MGPLCTSHHCCCCCVTRGVFIQHSDRIVHGAERRLFGPLRLEHLDLHHVELAPVRLLLLRTPTDALIFLSTATVPLTRPREANSSKSPARRRLGCLGRVCRRVGPASRPQL